MYWLYLFFFSLLLFPSSSFACLNGMQLDPRWVESFKLAGLLTLLFGFALPIFLGLLVRFQILGASNFHLLKISLKQAAFKIPLALILSAIALQLSIAIYDDYFDIFDAQPNFLKIAWFIVISFPLFGAMFLVAQVKPGLKRRFTFLLAAPLAAVLIWTTTMYLLTGDYLPRAHIDVFPHL